MGKYFEEAERIREMLGIPPLDALKLRCLYTTMRGEEILSPYLGWNTIEEFKSEFNEEDMQLWTKVCEVQKIELLDRDTLATVATFIVTK